MQGYLLERLGDVTSALAIYCDAADRANNELVAAILGGGLPLGSLPIPAQTRLARAGRHADQYIVAHLHWYYITEKESVLSSSGFWTCS